MIRAIALAGFGSVLAIGLYGCRGAGNRATLPVRNPRIR
jgi:hypothetical protein